MNEGLSMLALAWDGLCQSQARVEWGNQVKVWRFKVEVGNFPGGTVDKNLPANTEDMCSVLVWEDSTCCRATKPVSAPQLSPRAATTEACVPHSPCSTTREATAMKCCSTAMKTNPYLLQIEKAHVQQ